MNTPIMILAIAPPYILLSGTIGPEINEFALFDVETLPMVLPSLT